MGISKRLEQARGPCKKRDLTTSGAAHSPQVLAESHQDIGDMVCGRLDGIASTFALVTRVAGAWLSARISLVYSPGPFFPINRGPPSGKRQVSPRTTGNFPLSLS
jgi:hypothetical protein